MFSRSPRRSVSLLITLLALMATACGTNSEGETIGVASLEDTASAEIATDPEPEGESTPELAILEFSQCMRDEDLDFPDIGVDANGNPDIRDAFANADIQPGSPEFQDAVAACSEILQDAGFGGGRRAALADNTELQDALVELSACIRDQGYDVGDLTFGGGPAPGGAPGGDASGDPPERGAGRGQADFGDRSARLAQGLGLDIDDPDVAAAIDECEPILDAALSGLGLGQGPGQG